MKFLKSFGYALLLFLSAVLFLSGLSTLSKLHISITPEAIGEDLACAISLGIGYLGIRFSWKGLGS